MGSKKKTKKAAQDFLMSLAKEFGIYAVDFATDKVVPRVVEKVQSYHNTNCGGKVKKGDYAKRPIEIINDNLFIVNNRDLEDFIPITLDNVKVCKYKESVEHKYTQQTYFYYLIVFQNNKRSLIRVNQDGHDILDRYTQEKE